MCICIMDVYNQCLEHRQTPSETRNNSKYKNSTTQQDGAKGTFTSLDKKTEKHFCRVKV